MQISRLKIDALQAEQGMTNGKLAEKAGICRQNLSTIKTRGTCHILTAGKLAAALGVDVEEIISQEV